MSTSVSLNPYSGASPSISPSASISPGSYTTPQLMQQLNQLMQQSSRAIPVNNGNSVAFNAHYAPPIQLPQSMGLSAFGPPGSGVDYELPKGNKPVDRLRRALLLASTQRSFWTPSQTISPAYSPGFVKDIIKLEKLKNMITKDITVLPYGGMGSKVLIYGMAIKMPGTGTKFTYMTFHSCPYVTTASLDTEDDMFFVPNNMLFVASQHKEFSIGVIPYHDEEKRDEVLKSVREFIDGFCEINIKPLMTNLVGVFMGNIVFLAPSKRVASLAKALFDVQYVSVMNIHKDWDIELPQASNALGTHITDLMGANKYGGAMSGAVGGGPIAPTWTTTTAGNTSSTGNLKWTNLQNSFTKFGDSMTSATNIIKKYFSSNNCSS